MAESTPNHLGWHLVAESSTVQPGQLLLVGPSWGLGRSSKNAVVVAEEVVSRYHAVIVREDEQFRLSDVGSRNGTYVNGKVVRSSHILMHRDLIGLGNAKPHLRFVNDHAIANPVRGQSNESSHHTRLHFDDRRLRFSIYGQLLDLSPDEFRLLRCLHRTPGDVCDRFDLADAIWGVEAHRHEPSLDRLVDALTRKLHQLDPEITITRTRITGGFILTI
jgi:DNA-binding response OmpR family regulator